MKKLILFFTLLLFIGCSKNEDVVLQKKYTTYQIINTIPFSSNTGSAFGDLNDVQVFGFNSRGEIIETQHFGCISSCYKGKADTTEQCMVNDSTVMLRISFNYIASALAKNQTRQYDVIRHYLKIGENNEITISATTMVSSSIYYAKKN